MNVDVDTLLSLIGEREVQLHLLRRELAVRQGEIASLQQALRSAQTPPVIPSPQ